MSSGSVDLERRGANIITLVADEIELLLVRIMGKIKTGDREKTDSFFEKVQSTMSGDLRAWRPDVYGNHRLISSCTSTPMLLVRDATSGLCKV